MKFFNEGTDSELIGIQVKPCPSHMHMHMLRFGGRGVHYVRGPLNSPFQIVLYYNFVNYLVIII